MTLYILVKKVVTLSKIIYTFITSEMKKIFISLSVLLFSALLFGYITCN